MKGIRGMFGAKPTRLTAQVETIEPVLEELGPLGLLIIAGYLTAKGLYDLAQKIRDAAHSGNTNMPLTPEERQQVEEAIRNCDAGSKAEPEVSEMPMSSDLHQQALDILFAPEEPDYEFFKIRRPSATFKANRKDKAPTWTPQTKPKTQPKNQSQPKTPPKEQEPKPLPKALPGISDVEWERTVNSLRIYAQDAINQLKHIDPFRGRGPVDRLLTSLKWIITGEELARKNPELYRTLLEDGIGIIQSVRNFATRWGATLSINDEEAQAWRAIASDIENTMTVLNRIWTKVTGLPPYDWNRVADMISRRATVDSVWYKIGGK